MNLPLRPFLGFIARDALLAALTLAALGLDATARAGGRDDAWLGAAAGVCVFSATSTRRAKSQTAALKPLRPRAWSRAGSRASSGAAAARAPGCDTSATVSLHASPSSCTRRDWFAGERTLQYLAGRTGGAARVAAGGRAAAAAAGPAAPPPRART